MITPLVFAARLAAVEANLGTAGMRHVLAQ
jgi:hypothetical protein